MNNYITEQIEDSVYYIDFDIFESSNLFTSYAYNITNSKIEQALLMLDNPNIYNLIDLEINNDWQDANLLAESKNIADDMKHVLRVAMLVKRFTNGYKVNPVSIDTFSRAPSFLEGHHRLLALKYLGYKSFPAYLSGYVDILEENLHVNMG